MSRLRASFGSARALPCKSAGMSRLLIFRRIFMPCRTFLIQDQPHAADVAHKLLDLLSGRMDPGASVEPRVRAILDDVRARGDDALAEYASRFDCPGFTKDMLCVPAAELEKAFRSIPERDAAVIREAADNIRVFHEGQKRNSWFMTRKDGSIFGQMVRPVDRAGLYVPGGQGGNTPLISSLLMTAIPAQVAGVESIAVTSPSRSDGTLNPYILATAHILGLDEVHPVGSAWALAALAYGTQSIRRVDCIAGPGNIFVTTAKRLLMGIVGIDMLAGPSEVLIIADESARAAQVAADMLSQAEHDALASAILLTPSAELAKDVKEELARQCALLPRADIAAKALADWSAIAVTPDLACAVELANLIAPEHLEILTKDPWSVSTGIRHAGAMFLGPNSPEPIGDYFAGPNHVLPTMGTARFSSALSVETFCKNTSIIAASPAFSNANAASVARLARLECLEAHARSMEMRITGPKN